MTDPAPLGPNQRQTAATTAGISRNMQAEPDPLGGGGDVNGSAATHFLGQGGTGANKLALPRDLRFGRTISGTV